MFVYMCSCLTTDQLATVFICFSIRQELRIIESLGTSYSNNLQGIYIFVEAILYKLKYIHLNVYYIYVTHRHLKHVQHQSFNP